MVLARAFGVRIILNNFFLLLLVVYAFLGLLPEIIILFSIVVLHEITHIIVATGLGLKVREIELLPVGGVARFEDLIELDPSVEARVAMAGPVNNLILAVIVFILSRDGALDPDLASFIIQGNLAVGIFNLLPILPLDGGRIFRAILAGRMGYKRATDLTIILGRGLALLMATGGAVGAYLGRCNIIVAVLAVFLYVSAARERLTTAYVIMRQLARRKSDLMSRGVMPAHDLVAMGDVPLKEVMRNFLPGRYHRVIVLNERWVPMGTLTEDDIIDGLVEYGIDAPVASLLRARK
ncbi:MAG TPA: peptidase M50 [Firmicutes bacterium]|nr:peptidase M50 [Bacillota bacterium]